MKVIISKKNIKNIIFDFGNVLMTFNAKEIAKKFTSSEEEQDFIVNNVVNSPEWGGWSLPGWLWRRREGP